LAGLGRRTFSPGEVLTATNVMGYLQDQAVMNFAGTAARGSAIGTAVSEGMISYLADTNRVEVYDGSAWATLVKAPVHARVAGEGNSTSATYTDLSTAGPAVTLRTGSKALVTLGGRMYSNTLDAYIYIGFSVSGASTISASDDYALHARMGKGDMSVNVSRQFVITVTPGVNTFTAKYRVGAGAGAWFLRDIIVQDLGD